MEARRKVWRVNVHRLITRIGSWNAHCVWPTYAGECYFHDNPKPPAAGKYDGGSSINGEKFYETEDAAWTALGEQFEAWVAETRDVIARRGVPKPEPVKARKKRGVK